MNTQFWGWTFPDEHADPWYDTLNRCVREIDLTVHSLAEVVGPRFTCALSWHPGGIPATTVISSATDTNYGGVGDGRWTVLSCAPYGRAVGSFAVLHPGGQVLLTLNTGGFVSGGGTITGGSGTLRVRGVVRGGPNLAVQSHAFPSNSAW